jgi:hypothetical protein
VASRRKGMDRRNRNLHMI